MDNDWTTSLAFLGRSCQRANRRALELLADRHASTSIGLSSPIIKEYG
jgi:hypothetical protein